MVNVVDGYLSHPPPHPLPAPQCLLGRNLPDGFQIADFVPPGLRNLYLDKARLLVECRAENILFHKANPQSSNNCYRRVWGILRLAKATPRSEVKSFSRVRLFATPWTPGSSVHGIF